MNPARRAATKNFKYLWLGFNRETGLFRHCSLSRIERDKLPGPDDDGGGDVDDVECAAAEDGRVTGGKFPGLLFNGGSGIDGTPPTARGDILLESGDGLVHFHRSDLLAKGLQANGVFDFQSLPLR